MSRFNDATTLEYCLLELVLNSLKAQSTAIAIRIHHRDHKIQVVDNGSGISKCALKYLGKHSIEKEKPLPRDLKKENILGEGSLGKIRGLSSGLIIMSRSQFTTETYGKCFSNGRVSKVQRIEDRPSSGTTVTVYASSKLCNWGEEINCSAVKFLIVYLSLVNTQVSFSVRDDMKGSILLRVGKYQKKKRLFRVLFEQSLNPGQIQRIKPQILGKIKISGFWGVDCSMSKKLQQVLVNLRPVHYPLLEKFMPRILSKICYPHAENSNSCLERIFFLVYIECPDCEFNISVKNNEKTEVDFPQNEEILNSIRLCITKTEVEELKPKKSFGCKPIISLITSRPMQRISGAKQKRSFLTKVSNHQFQRTMAIAETKGKMKSLSGNKEPMKLGSKDFNAMNCEIDRGVPQNINVDDSALIKRQNNGTQDSRGSQEPKKETEPNKSKTTLLTPSTIRDIKIPSKNNDYEKLRISILKENCVQSHDKRKSPPITQSKIYDASENETPLSTTSTSRNMKIPSMNDDSENLRISILKENCVPSHDKRKSPRITQSKIQDVSKNETPLSTPSTSQDIKIPSMNDDSEKLRISILKESSIQSHDKSKSPPITQSRIQNASVCTEKCDRENYQPKLSQKLVEKSHDIGKLPMVSDYISKDYVEDAEVRKSQKRIEESLLNSGSKFVGETFSAAKEYQYDNHGVLWISQKSNAKLTNRLEEIYDVGCSQWSDWNYEPDTGNCVKENFCEAARPVLYKRFKFLPLNLHALLPFLNEKLIKDLTKEVEMPTNLNLNHRPQDFDVRPCTRRSLEFRLKIESLKSMKVLSQVNNEFIVALTQQDDKKLVVVVDQHAMHERIRYENLLRAYKRDQKNQQFISITLHHPIIISDLSISNCNLLSSNQDLLTRYGLSLAFRNETTLLIFAVPRCFLKKTYRTDNVEVEISVRKLLQEVLDNLTTNGVKKFLPFTIHDAIASEACHGSIKFGDPLTLKQCESLISCWKETDAPNRCAHGRPSVIPLLELSSHRRNHYKLVGQEKLNYASLRKFQRTTGKIRGTELRYHPYVTLAKNQESRFQFDDEALR